VRFKQEKVINQTFYQNILYIIAYQNQQTNTISYFSGTTGSYAIKFQMQQNLITHHINYLLKSATAQAGMDFFDLSRTSNQTANGAKPPATETDHRNRMSPYLAQVVE